MKKTSTLKFNIGDVVEIIGKDYTHTGKISRINDSGFKIDCNDGVTIGISKKDIPKFEIRIV